MRIRRVFDDKSRIDIHQQHYGNLHGSDATSQNTVSLQARTTNRLRLGTINISDACYKAAVQFLTVPPHFTKYFVTAPWPGLV